MDFFWGGGRGGMFMKMFYDKKEKWDLTGLPLKSVHVSTAYAEYILMSPSEAYKPYMDTMREKIHMSKVVIEFMQNNQEATYEDLLNKIQVHF